MVVDMYSCHLETPAPRGEHPYPAVPTHNAEIYQVLERGEEEVVLFGLPLHNGRQCAAWKLQKAV